jgi:hypothetical protein
MKKFLTMLLLLSSTTAFAALNKWADADGKVHYSDEPPPANIKSETLRTSPSAPAPSAASAPAATKSLAEREAELKKAQQAKKEAEERAAQEQSRRETEKANCAAARQHLRTLQEGGRMVEIDAQGEYTYLEDEQRQQRIAKAQEDIKTWCK